MASACGMAKRSVASPNGIGRTFSETCTTSPKVPSAPAIRRDTSYPATFFITWPPKFSRSPRPSMTTAPSTKSRSAPTDCRRGPDRPAAKAPPTVACLSPPAKCGGSKASIWRCSASAASTSASGVPLRAVTTSSAGS